MENRRATSRYAKACRECAKTKAKCVQLENASKCDRCTRLNKECKARIATSRAPRAPKPNRLAQMEQKLDGLATLLVARQPKRQSSTSPDSAPVLTPSSSPSEIMTVQGGPFQVPIVPDVSLQDKTKVYLCSGEQSTNRQENVIGNMTGWPKCHLPEGNKPIPSLDLTDEAAEILLENYQTSMARYFPFVVIPVSTAVQELQTTKPYLFLVIMTVSSFQRTGQQSTLSMEVMRRLSDQIIFKGEKSLDLLQGILVYVEWYQSHRLLDPQLTNLLHLATAILVDLGLNKTPYTFDHHQQQTFPDTTEILNGRIIARGRSNDERRAFLGCFYLTSTISSCFKKVDGIRYTPHLEESCNVLSQHPEYESDKYLVQLVKLQGIAEQVTQTLPYDLPQSLWAPGTPIKLLVNGFQRELQSFQASLPQSLKEDILLQSHILNTSTHLFEISLSDWSRQQQHSTITSTSINSTNPPHHRLEILHRALLSSSSLLTAFLDYPGSEYSSLPFVMWGQLVHAMQVLSKLSQLAATPSPPSFSFTYPSSSTTTNNSTSNLSCSFPSWSSSSTTTTSHSASFPPACTSSTSASAHSPTRSSTNAATATAASNNDIHDNLLVPGWSLSHVQETIDFPTILDKLIAKFEEQRIIEEASQPDTTTTATTTPAPDRSPNGSGGGGIGIGLFPPFGSRYEIYAGRLLRVKAWYEVKLRSLQGGRGPPPSATSGFDGAGATPNGGGGGGRGEIGTEIITGIDASRDLQTDLYGVLGGPAQPAGTLPLSQQQQQQQKYHMGGATGAGGAGGTAAAAAGMGMDSEFLSLEMLEQMDDVYWRDFLTEWASL